LLVLLASGGVARRSQITVDMLPPCALPDAKTTSPSYYLYFFTAPKQSFKKCSVPDTEADTCRKFVVPRLQATGWEDEPHSIAEQRRIVAELDALLPVILDKAFQGDL